MPSIYEVISDCAGPDPEAAAQHVFDKLGVPKRWADVFRPIIQRECVRAYRPSVVALRDEATATNTSRPQPPPDHPNPTGQAAAGASTRARVLAESIYVNAEIGRVPLGKMTADLHKARIAFVTPQIEARLRDIEFHERCIADIEKAGVTCLDEIPGWGVGDAA